MQLPFLNEFLGSVFVEGSGSKHTQKSYARDLSVFSDFLSSSKGQLTKFQQNHLGSYCTKLGLSRRSQARIISALRSYFRYLQRQGHIKEIPKLEIVQHTRSLPQVVSDDEIQQLLLACDTSEDDEKLKLRNKAVLSLLYATGCRVSELCTLNLSDLQMDLRILKVTGKGSKQRMVPLVTKAIESLNAYLKVRLDLSDPTERALIVNDRGHRPSRVDVFRWLKKWSKFAGFSKNVSPHMLRHACATHLLRGGVDLRTIQSLLGHANIATTEIYTKIENPDLHEAISNFHPLGREV